MSAQSKINLFFDTPDLPGTERFKYSPQWQQSKRSVIAPVATMDHPKRTISSSKLSLRVYMHACVGGPVLMSLLAQKRA